MNENLQRLLPNPFATDYTGKIADERMVDLYTEKELEKFAELIIKECAEVCKTGAVSNIDYNTGRLHCYSDIINHFGVK